MAYRNVMTWNIWYTKTYLYLTGNDGFCLIIEQPDILRIYF